MTRLPLGKLTLSSLAGLAVLLLACTQVMAAFTCTTVARRLQVDPEGNVFSNVVRDDFGVHDSGDVVFAAKVGDGRERLCRYRGSGAGEVIAEAGGPGPEGMVFGVNRPLANLQVRRQGSVSLVERDSTGRRVLLSRSSTGVWSVGDGEGDAKPGSTIKRIVSAVL
ncbi:MAG: hypothetical protein P8R42_08165 [Candidatus Binatia bacterium]|nr:hypothetical protein [Candidatus Binatia bacterium]